MTPVGPLPDERIPVVLSAHEEDLVAPDATALLGFIRNGATVAAVAATLLRTRRIRRHRSVIRAADIDELSAGLHAVTEGADHPLVTRSSASTTRRTAFVFPGHGNQWPGMGADAYHRIAVYRAEADRCAEAFVAAGAPSPVPYLTEHTDAAWARVQTQAAQFTHSVALARTWFSCGVLPDIVVGHSLGEISAAYAAGLMSLQDAVDVIIARAAVLDSLPGRYAVAAVAVDADAAAGLADSTPGWLEVSVVNSPSSTAIAGTEDAVAELLRRMEDRGVFARAIAMNFPAHTSVLEPLRDDFLRRLPDGAFTASPVEFIGSARGSVLSTDTDFRSYWYENLRSTVRFDKAVRTAAERGAGVFVEMSAHPALLMPLAELVDEDGTGGIDVVASSRRDEPLLDYLSAAITAVASADPGYRWIDLVPPWDAPPPRGFPNAPMRAQHLWMRSERPRSEPATTVQIALEQWESMQPTAHAGSHTVAVVAAPDADDVTVQALRDAIATHPVVQQAPSGDADVIVVVAPADSDDDADSAVHRLCALVESGLLRHPRGRRATWLITAGGERARASDPPARPLQAAMSALHRSVGYEHPETTFGHVDLPHWNVGADTARRVVDLLPGDAVEVALRDEATYYERVLRFSSALPKPLPSRAFTNVVITGGGGAVGLALAEYCARRGAARIVLLARRPPSADAVAALRAPGVDIVTASCDVTDPESVAAAAIAHAGGDASLLIHAAGSAVIAPSGDLGPEDVRHTLAAKVSGLSNMLASWPLGERCRVVLCSSASAVWGGIGHAAYSAANRMLDTMADQLREQGWDAVSVRSGSWQGPGVLDDEAMQRVSRSGLVAMPPGLAAATLLAEHDADPVMFTADLDRLRIFFEHRSIKTAWTEPSNEHLTDRSADIPTAGSTRDVVRAALASVLGLSAADVDLGPALVDVGVDSLLALDLRKRLLRATGRAVPLPILLGGITGMELAATLSEGAHVARD